MTAGDGMTHRLQGLGPVEGETLGGVLDMNGELKGLGKALAQVTKQIETLDRNPLPHLPNAQRRAELTKQRNAIKGRIATVKRRAFKALAAN